jgi:predicted peroxiredoxin
MRVLIKSAWGSADPTQAAFPFHHAIAFAEAGHEVQIFLLGEAVSLMRSVVAGSVIPVGWPPLSEALATVVTHRVPIHV